LRVENKAVLAYLRQTDDAHMLIVCNLSDRPQKVRFDLSEFAGRVPKDVLNPAQQPFTEISTVPYAVELQPYQFHWFSL